MTVLVTTERTLTGRTVALRGCSKKRWPLLSRFQSAGENGERAMALVRPAVERVAALRGEPAGDCGIVSLRRLAGVHVAEMGLTNGDGGGADALVFLCKSCRLKEKLEDVD